MYEKKKNYINIFKKKKKKLYKHIKKKKIDKNNKIAKMYLIFNWNGKYANTLLYGPILTN